MGSAQANSARLRSHYPTESTCRCVVGMPLMGRFARTFNMAIWTLPTAHGPSSGASLTFQAWEAILSWRDFEWARRPRLIPLLGFSIGPTWIIPQRIVIPFEHGDVLSSRAWSPRMRAFLTALLWHMWPKGSSRITWDDGCRVDETANRCIRSQSFRSRPFQGETLLLDYKLAWEILVCDEGVFSEHSTAWLLIIWAVCKMSHAAVGLKLHSIAEFEPFYMCRSVASPAMADGGG